MSISIALNCAFTERVGYCKKGIWIIDGDLRWLEEVIRKVYRSTKCLKKSKESRFIEILAFVNSRPIFLTKDGDTCNVERPGWVYWHFNLNRLLWQLSKRILESGKQVHWRPGHQYRDVWWCIWENRCLRLHKLACSLTLSSWLNDSQCPTIIRSQETAWWRLSPTHLLGPKILELEHLSQSFNQLRQARNKFLDCIKSINEGAKEEYEGSFPDRWTNFLTV